MPWWQTRIYREGLTEEFAAEPEPVEEDADGDEYVPIDELGANVTRVQFG